MAQKGQATPKRTGTAADIDRLTGYNPKCPDCLRNNKKVDKKFPCYACIHKLDDPHIVSLVGVSEAKRGNLDVFRNLISARNYGSIPVEERMLLEDRYREAIRNNEPGWDDTLEPLKCPHTDAYRKKFTEDQEKMRAQQMEDELRAKINAQNKKASEQAAREALPSTSGLAAPTGMASLNEDEMQLVRQSLIIQIETLTKDPAAMSDEIFKMLLREKKRLQDGFAPAPYIKKEVERRMDDLRKSRRTESDVLQALRSFKRDEGFIRPRSPPHRERSRGHSREHERISERRSERSREHSRERTRDYHSERSRERSRDRDYRGGRGWVRHGDEVTEMSIQRKIDTTKLLAATREREDKRRAETFRTEPEKQGHQVPMGVAFRNRNVRMSTPERSWDKRREHTRNRTPDPQDKRWQQRAAFYATFDSGASKRSSSTEREDSPPKYQRVESVVHVVDPIVSVVQEDDAMEGTSSIAETSQENVTHRRNIILDSDLQLEQPASNEPSQPEPGERREPEGQREPDNYRRADQRQNSRFDNRQPDTIDMEYNTTDIDEQTVEICRYFGLEPDSVEANKIGTILRQLSQFLLDSGYAREIKQGVEQGLFRQLFIHRDSVRDCYLPIRRNGLHSLVDLSLLDVPLDTTDPIGMTQFYYRDYPERQEYVAQFVLRHVNPAFKLLAARASIGLQVDPKDYAAKRMGQKVFAARLAHYKTQNQLVSNTMKDDIPPFFRAHVAKLGQPMEHISIAHTARKALKKCKTRMEKGNLTQRHASQVEERINKIKDSLGSDYVEPVDGIESYIDDFLVKKSDRRPDRAPNQMGRRGIRNQQLRDNLADVQRRLAEDPDNRRLRLEENDARHRLEAVKRSRQGKGRGQREVDPTKVMEVDSTEPVDRTSDRNQPESAKKRPPRDGEGDSNEME
ncbi:uncharacterized protein LOC129597422 [Paramacrobiotus metropolitanus]|uniref:uncharacterized protein LOC129597422 n=1 Tax=Paramacrobiotus metropolitanus TaxID=2943436 RepID=UPI0024459121|nr:uncharacterized protein LOC129597422 [Paramacrobiotus metropolitanus]XP_055350926.1 uncharacterized protein LOC129597422 [Paramacrobiotus metropolitanus]XP_055350927.1 uncharacterized protein LOC129597422 [Paramacrobiotus metropolitanus]XP_055350928.1 uncharacterized protein LOC129597422 [Paramacrobiotus metropolitanus]XP_055350929.1 uncharacterized protein LOC129597422 [Paramacrobiotus metropolitanus]XP_055350930.1 uncharacterized protein LOC129597422 [Paramacrobiotus metropolitanus]XP_05